jgi:tetratricopeptide (TPR) repeat protein
MPRDPPDDWEAYACTLSFYAYRADLDLGRLPAVRQCLEKAVARFPNYATAWGLLSQAYIDGVRFSFPFDTSTSAKSIELARSAAKRAIELDPLNVRGLQAHMFALFFSRDIAEALATGKRALAINPNDTELMGEYGYRLAQAGNWTEGCALVAEARDRNPGPSAYYDTALALCAYFSGRYDEAAILIRRAAALHNPNYHAIAAAIFAEAGYAEDAGRERAWLEANVPALIQNARREVALRFVRQEDVDFFLGSLRKAGLVIGS